MDLLMHAVHGFVMGAAINLETAVGCAIGGMSLDAVGWLEKVIKNRPKAWKWYLAVHKVSWKNPFMYFPPTLLHILLDSFTHTPGKNRWWIKEEGLKYEVGAWAITLVSVVGLILTGYFGGLF